MPPSRRGMLWLSVAITVVLGATITALVVWSFRHHGRRAGAPLAAEVRGEALALIDFLRGEDSSERRTTLVALATGAILSRELVDDTMTGIFSPPEQYCATTRDLGDASRLIVPPYAGQIGVAHRAEVPTGKVMVAPHTGAFGFLVEPATRAVLRLGEDVLYSHMYSFDANRPHAGPESWLSRVGPDGRAIWSRPLAGGCQLAVLRGDTLVVAMKSGAHRAIAIDVTTGLLRWQFDH